MSSWVVLAGGALMLYLGAEWFVSGASALALALRVPQIFVALTVVAYGTSAPEVIVGVEAAAGGHGDVALGNVIGSNIANVGLILGCAALVRPARVDGALRRRELPALLISTALVPLLLVDGTVSRVEAAALIVLALVYTALMVTSARKAAAVASAMRDAQDTLQTAARAGAPRPSGALRASAIAAVGLIVLLVGGSLFVNGAITLAHSFGMSERLIGLTIVALGTSLPELVTSILAARYGHSDLAVGNVLGSNIFNSLLCLGAAGLARPLVAPLRVLAPDLVALFVMTGLAALFIRTERTISRAEAGIALSLYGLLLAAAVVSG